MITENGNAAETKVEKAPTAKSNKNKSKNRSPGASTKVVKKAYTGKKRGPKVGTTHAIRVTLNELNSRFKPDQLIPIARSFHVENFESVDPGSVAVVAAQGKKVTVEYRREGRKPQIRVIDFSQNK